MFTDTSIFLAQEVEQPGLFPFPFGMHICFCLVALIFFAFRFKTDKQPYQLIMGIAIPLSLLLWLSDNRSLYYFVGALELVLMLAALISAFIWKRPEDMKEAAKEAAEEAAKEVKETAEEAAKDAQEAAEEAAEAASGDEE